MRAHTHTHTHTRTHAQLSGMHIVILHDWVVPFSRNQWLPGGAAVERSLLLLAEVVVSDQALMRLTHFTVMVSTILVEEYVIISTFVACDLQVSSDLCILYLQVLLSIILHQHQSRNSNVLYLKMQMSDGWYTVEGVVHHLEGVMLLVSYHSTPIRRLPHSIHWQNSLLQCSIHWYHLVAELLTFCTSQQWDVSHFSIDIVCHA